MIRIKIVPNDTTTVAKVVILDNKNRALFLKRSSYVDKYAGEWDLPGGHIQENESLLAGLERETKEETQLSIREPKFILQMDNLHFFYARYDSQDVKISHEHTEYKFFDKKDLDPSEKFQKVALKAIEEVES